MNNEYCVYCHTNRTNAKRYVGITKNNPNRRWMGGQGYKCNRHFYSAIQKYGWDNFEHEIIVSGLSFEDAKEIEKTLIKEWNLQDPHFGYNMTAGGDGLYSPRSETREKMSIAAKSEHRLTLLSVAREKAHKVCVGSRHSPETIQKMSQAKLGHAVSQETKDKISQSKRGHPSWNKGIPCSDETRKKISESAKKRKPISEETREKMRISQQKRRKKQNTEESL